MVSNKTLAGWVLPFLACTAIAQDGASGAKALFCTDSAICSAPALSGRRAQAPAKSATSVANPAAVPAAGAFGLSYWIDLQQPNGELVRVPSERKFNTGERIRVSMRPNRPGYLYVFNLGTSGHTSPLYPRNGETARTEAGQMVLIPNTNFLRFASPPGEELLLVVFSPTPIAEYTNRPAPMANQAAVTIADARSGAKDLMRDDDFDAPGASNASYVVAPRTDKAINLSIRLRHQ